MTLLANTSCLVTEGLEPRETEPPPANAWPRIIEESVTPKNWTPAVPIGDLECLPVELTIGTIADANVDDTLYVRAFVDYDPSGGPNKAVRDEDQILPSTPRQEVRSGYTFTFVPRYWCRGFHVVKVLVADGPFENFDQVQGSDRGVVSYSWVVDTSKCPNAGLCQ